MAISDLMPPGYMYARTMSGPPEDKGAGRYADWDDTTDPMEESWIDKHIGAPIEEAQLRKRIAQLKVENPGMSDSEAITVAKEERKQSSFLTASEALREKQNIFGELRPLPGIGSEQFQEYFKDTPQRLSKKDRREASVKATEEARARDEVGGLREMTEEEVTRARTNTEAALTPETLQEALDKTKEEAIIARTAGPPKPVEKGSVEEQVFKDVTAVGKGDKKPEDVAKTYMEEFMDMMPKYEGKTPFEKGMDLTKLGMAIAAGQDPNGIANITKGFLAMGDTFTEDAKERRKYKKEVAMAGAKHVLTRQKEDRDTTLAKSLLSAELLSNKDIARLKAQATAQARSFDITLDLAREGLITSKEAAEQGTKYNGLLKQYNTALEGKELVAYLAKKSLGAKGKKGEVLGLKGWGKSMINKGLNALRIRDMAAFEKLRSEDPEQYRLAQQRLAVSLADVLLKESGKTISDRDRELVRELVGGMVGASGYITADPDVLIEQFQYIAKKMDDEMLSSQRDMQVIENSYMDKIIKGSGEFDPLKGEFVGTEEKQLQRFQDVLPDAEEMRDAKRRTAFQESKPIQYTDLITEDGRIKSIKEIIASQEQA